MNRRDAIKTSALFLGYAVSSASLSSLFIRCQAEVKLDWKPVFLTPVQAQSVAEIAETILPETATPGAKGIGVPQFIDLMLHESLAPEEQQDFLAGLKKLEDDCQSAFGKPFVGCSAEQREALLLQLDREAAKLPPSVWGITLAPPSPVAFFRRLKSLTMLGYFTSKKVGSEILSYEPNPMGFQACIPLNGMNAWNE